MLCPLCRQHEMEVFFDSPGMPVFNNVLLPSRAEAAAAARGDIRLAFCGGCGLIYNTAFRKELAAYAPSYENSLHHSPRFQQYARGLAEEMVRRHGLKGKEVVEIGCGQGDFLGLLCLAGVKAGWGFDPSYRGQAAPPGVTIYPRTFAPEADQLPAEMVCCRQVLEHVAQPADFLSRLRRGLHDNTLVCFEVPNALWTLRDLGIWDILYEHCSYFLPESLRTLFLQVGFEPLRLEERFEGQFLLIEARAGQAAPPSSPAGEETLRMVRGFGQEYRRKLDCWRDRLAQFARQGKRAAVWGAGTKGVSFLNALGAEGKAILAAVDLNPYKRGRFIPLAGQPVIAPEQLPQLAVNAIILMNPAYRQEVEPLAARWAPGAEILEA